MDDVLTGAVLDFQAGRAALDPVRNLVLREAYHHLQRLGRKGEDEVSEFLLRFHPRIEGLLRRFMPQGIPFRHYLLRTLRWQWTTFRADRARQRRLGIVGCDCGLEVPLDEVVAEPEVPWEPPRLPELSPAARLRFVVLTLKGGAWVDDRDLEAVSAHTGVDLAWLHACRHRLRSLGEQRWARRREVLARRGETLRRRLLAEDEARREPDPERRRLCEQRARFYRERLARLNQTHTPLAPTHAELAEVLGIPKGTVDSGLHHLKRALGKVYLGQHDRLAGHEQPS